MSNTIDFQTGISQCYVSNQQVMLGSITMIKTTRLAIGVKHNLYSKQYVPVPCLLSITITSSNTIDIQNGISRRRVSNQGASQAEI